MYPKVKNKELVGTYPALVMSGGGYVWDDVLEYRVWCSPLDGEYVHIKERRLTEWPVEFLNRPRRTADTISQFLSADAPSNRLDILRGLL